MVNCCRLSDGGRDAGPACLGLDRHLGLARQLQPQLLLSDLAHGQRDLLGLGDEIQVLRHSHVQLQLHCAVAADDVHLRAKHAWDGIHPRLHALAHGIGADANGAFAGVAGDLYVARTPLAQLQPN